MVNFLKGSILDRINYIKNTDGDTISAEVDTFIDYDIFDASNEDMDTKIEMVQDGIKTVITADFRVDTDGYSGIKDLHISVEMFVDDKEMFSFSPSGTGSEFSYEEKGDASIVVETGDNGTSFQTVKKKGGNTALRTNNKGGIALGEVEEDGRLGEQIGSNGASAG